MKIIFENGKIYEKKLFKKVEITPQELSRITDNQENGTVTLYFRDNRPEIQTKEVFFFFDEIDYFIRNGVSYEALAAEGSPVTADEVSRQVEKIKEIITPIASRMIKKSLGEESDIDISVDGELYYLCMLLRIKHNGVLVENHPSYSGISEQMPKAIDLIELSFLYKWDAKTQEIQYGLVHNDLSEDYWENYLRNCLQHV